MYRDRKFGSYRGGGGSFAPVNVGDEIEVKIEAVGEKGDGIAKIKGFVIFVPNAKQGETVKVRITKVLRKVGFGEIVGKGSKKEKEEESMEEMPEAAETAEASETEESYEDSESFGEKE